jgi:thioredoxin 1
MEEQDIPHNTLTLTDQNFAEEVASFDGVVLVDFWAPWCQPCIVMAPFVEQIATKYKDNPKVKVGKLNVDENEETSMKYRVMSLPTFKIFVNGNIVDELIGSVGGPAIEQFLDKAVATSLQKTA